MLLITGATGFVGRNVVSAFASRSIPLRCLVHSPQSAEVIREQPVEIVYGDVLDSLSLKEALAGVETVVHVVAVIREKGPLTFERVNHQGTSNLVQVAKEAGVKRFIDASAIGAANDPTIPYLYSRWLAEQEIINSGIPYTILRFSLGFGEGDEFFNTLAALVKALPIVPIVGDGKALFQPMAVEEIAECFVRAYEDENTVGKVIEIGGPEHLTYEEIIDLIKETLQMNIVKVHVPLSVMRPLVRAMDALLPKPPVTSEQLKMLKLDNVTDLQAVEKNFGFVPKPIRGNIDYVTRLSYMDALKINLGFMPAHIRDH